MEENEENQENNDIQNENEENIENNNNIDNQNNEYEQNIENNNNINNENQNEIQNENNNENQNQENIENNNQQNVQNDNQQLQQNNQIINNNQQLQQNPNVQQGQQGANIQNEIAKRRKEEAKKTVEIIRTKIKTLKNNFNFSLQFYDIITKIIKNFQDLTYEKLTNTIKETYNYFSFFKNSSELYSKFAEQIHTSNNTIMSSLNLPKLNDNFLLGVMQKTQNLLFQNLSQISNGLKQNIISKGPLSQLEDKITKIDFIKKMNSNKFKEIEEQKKQLVKKFHKYDKLFESYLPQTNLNNPNPNHNNNNVGNRIQRPPLVDTPDFVFIVHNLLEAINKLIVDINLFIVDTKDCFYKMNVLYVEMNNLVRDAVLIYIRESKKVFNIDVAKNFEEIENYYKNLKKNKQDKIFKLNQIFSTNKSQEAIHTLLQQYYVLLCNSGRVKKEFLTDRNTFSIEQYSNLLLFFEWLISISPQPTGLSSEDLVMKRFKVKRDPGIFKGWRDSILVFTRQHHLLLYDTAEKIENFAKIFEVDKINFRRKLDNKRPFMFELIATRKGKIMDFKGNYLFDALSEKNLNEIHPMILDSINPLTII